MKLAFRAVYDVGLVLVVFSTPWWFGATVALLSLLVWPHYYEAALAIFFHDLIFEAGELNLLGQWQFARTALVLVLTPAVELAKRRIIFYH